MKYLGIHKLIWLLIVITYTTIEGILWMIGWTICLIWNLKPSFPWSYIHSAECDFENKWSGYSYSDKTYFDTIIRRYYRIFE